MALPPPANQPTLYFIGVSTGQSSIMRVFPAWAAHLGLDAEIKGIDFPLHADPAIYREAIKFIRDDPMSMGALVTTHKIDLFKACHELFDVIDPHAALMGETSCISKENGRLVCHAKDPISSGLSIDGFLPAGPFRRDGGRSLLDWCRRFDHRADLAYAPAARRERAEPYHRLQPQPGAVRRDPRASTVACRPRRSSTTFLRLSLSRQ